MEKEKKVGLTPLNWFLCIIGILFFTTIIVLPPMFRAFIPGTETNDGSSSNENNNAEETPKPVVTKTTICIKNEIDKEEYRIISEDGINKIIAYTNESDYDETDIFNSCEQEADSFITADGLYNDCKIDKDKKILTHRITLKDYKELTSPMPFDLSLTSKEITDYLILNGFSCNDETGK